MKYPLYMSVEQGTPEHWHLRMGVIPASEILKGMAKEGTDTRMSFLCSKVAEIATGEMPELNARALEWGKENEPKARSLYEFTTNSRVTQVGFIYGQDKRTGCSPDGVITELRKGVEIKCPYSSRVHIEFLTTGKIKPEYIAQMQFSMWITGFESWDFVSFDPRMKRNMLHVQTIERDLACMQKYETEIPKLIAEMDRMLEIAGFTYGDQWRV
jgi:hypothetical protein